jgi:hypothetical protein
LTFAFFSATHASVCHWFALQLSSDHVIDMLEAASQCAVDLSISLADVAHSIWRMVQHSQPNFSNENLLIFNMADPSFAQPSF